MQSTDKQRGLTLIELLVTISIAAILLTIAVPSFQDFLARNRLDGATSDFMASLAYARSEAIRRGVRVTMRNTAGNNNWGGGWTMFVDTDGDGTLDADEDTLRTGQPLPAPLTMISSSFQNFLSYLPTGRSNGAGTFAVCYDNTLINRSRAIVLNMSGRPRVAVDSNNDGIPNKDDGSNIGSCTDPGSI